MRIDSDFGGACDPSTGHCLDELNHSRAAEFAPLFARRSLDVPWAYIDIASIGRGAVDLRLGRQFVVDVFGFLLFDGALARLHIGRAVAVEVYGGLEARTGFTVSNGRFERDGTIRADRAGWDQTLVPGVRDSAMAGVLGAAIELRHTGPVHARATWRRVWTSEGVAEEKAGLRVDLALGPRAESHAEFVWSVPHALASVVAIGATWRTGQGMLFGVDVQRIRPVFDATSLWASFWTDPTDDARARVEIPLGRVTRLNFDALARRYALSESSSALDDRANYGGGASVHVRHPRWELSTRLRGEGGELGLRVGADASARRWLTESVHVDGGVSLWSIDDALRAERNITSGSIWVGLNLRLGRVARAHFTIEDDVNRIVGQRLRAFVVFDLGAVI